MYDVPLPPKPTMREVRQSCQVFDHIDEEGRLVECGAFAIREVKCDDPWCDCIPVRVCLQHTLKFRAGTLLLGHSGDKENHHE